MPYLQKLVVLLFAIAAIALGVRTILRQEARVCWSGSEDEDRVVEGYPAVLMGIGEIITGLSLLFYQHLP